MILTEIIISVEQTHGYGILQEEQNRQRYQKSLIPIIESINLRGNGQYDFFPPKQHSPFRAVVLLEEWVDN